MYQARLETHHQSPPAHMGQPAAPVKSPAMASLPLVDLTAGPHSLPQLSACDSVADVRTLESPLFLDLSQCGMSLPFQNYTRVHLKFPSTLLRRPKFQFSQLVQTLDHNTRDLLTSAVTSHSVFVFYDEGSTLQSCSSHTSNILTKIIPYLIQLKSQQHNNTKFLFLQGGKTKLQEKLPLHQPVPFPRPPHLKNSRSAPNVNKPATKNGLNKHNMNLKITIPSRNTRADNSDYMFIQSFKKDSIHYSPDSLQKYFNFHMPPKIEPEDEILPAWLKNYSKDGSKNLLRILNAFECLEKLEVQRLERCLQSSKEELQKEDKSNTQIDVQTASDEKAGPTQKTRLRKPYSFRKMQKQFKPDRHDYDSDNDGYHQAEELKLKMDIHEELHGGENQELISKLIKLQGNDNLSTREANRINNSKNNHTEVQDEDEDEVVETPMDDYLLTRGIQSYTKNRYSNILPYEHSRVKLEPSPVWSDNKHGPLSCTVTPGSNSPLSNKAIRKRRNSYFSQDCSSRERSSEHSSDQKPETVRSSLRPPLTSHDSMRTTLTPNTASDNDTFNDYFNANYLKMPQINPDFSYIATQAPLPSTLDDFWKVVVANGVKVILSLNSDDELSMRKWDIYWNSTSLKKFDVSVSDNFENVGGVKGCILRVFKVRRKVTKEHNKPGEAKVSNNVKIVETEANGTIAKKTKAEIMEGELPTCKNGSEIETAVHTICQLQYTKWLDSCGINMSDVLKLHRIKNLLLNNAAFFIESIRHGKVYEDIMNAKDSSPKDTYTSDLTKAPEKSPLLVHCSAGCGRTGVFITLDFLINVFERPTDNANRIDVWNMPQDLIFIVVNELRKQRISMVQNLTQYITCYEAILKYFELRKITGNCDRVH
ncbi:LANO_0H14488g1_1 [Lachancea nothofagi CBS 11611]|uniref:LANO_0H14488g1_1 n=1 Tax=Lachancea nothofagi CBS 11611 TaxID=1266666 RepID=A0A1G4KMW3_9SACH|nr:LANO_0H14488g1_1 [Lachancea nothofagi CBS 11611]